MPKIKKICQICDKRFETIQSRIKNGKGKYCSRECFYQSIRNGKPNKGYFKKGHKGYLNDGNFKKNNIPWNKNVTGYSLPVREPISQQTREKMRMAKLGRKLPQTHKDNISKGVSKHLPRTAYKARFPHLTDIILIAKQIRQSAKYRQWAKQIVQQDKCICQICQTKKRLEAHHIVDFLSIINEVRYGYIDRKITYKRALKYIFLWDIHNGITVCKRCHIRYHIELEKSRIA